MFGQPVETITIVSRFVGSRRGVVYVKRVKRNRYCNILSIEKYLDGCVKILSLGRLFFFFFL